MLSSHSPPMSACGHAPLPRPSEDPMIHKSAKSKICFSTCDHLAKSNSSSAVCHARLWLRFIHLAVGLVDANARVLRPAAQPLPPLLSVFASTLCLIMSVSAVLLPVSPPSARMLIPSLVSPVLRLSTSETSSVSDPAHLPSTSPFTRRARVSRCLPLYSPAKTDVLSLLSSAARDLASFVQL